jgi:hypothetical protein
LRVNLLPIHVHLPFVCGKLLLKEFAGLPVQRFSAAISGDSGAMISFLGASQSPAWLAAIVHPLLLLLFL